MRRGFVCGWIYFWIAFAISFEFSLLKPLLLSAAIWKIKPKISHSWLFWDALGWALPCLVESSLVYCGNNLDNLDLSWRFPLSVIIWGCRGGRSRHRWILLKPWQGLVTENELDQVISTAWTGPWLDNSLGCFLFICAKLIFFLLLENWKKIKIQLWCLKNQSSIISIPTFPNGFASWAHQIILMHEMSPPQRWIGQEIWAVSQSSDRRYLRFNSH